MKIFLFVLLIFLAIVFSLLFVKLNFHFKASYSEKNEVKFLLRFFVFNEKLGFNVKFKETKKEKKKKEEENIKAKEEHEPKFLEKINNFKKQLKIIKNVHEASKGHIKKTIVIKNVSADVKIGFSDAAMTGIATGALWSVIYSAFAFIAKNFTVIKHDFNIDPIFNKKIFEVNVDGVVYATAINVLTTMFIIYKNYKKAKSFFDEYKIEPAKEVQNH